jgi:hypothetical protein
MTPGSSTEFAVLTRTTTITAYIVAYLHLETARRTPTLPFQADSGFGIGGRWETH